MTAIETALTQHGGAFDGAAGPVRSVASRTGDLLPAVARVATFLYPEADLDDRVARLLVRLELGIQGAAVALARHVGGQLTRGDYQALVRLGFTTPETIEAVDENALLNCLGGDENKAQMVRVAVAAIRAEADAIPAPTLPDYEE